MNIGIVGSRRRNSAADKEMVKEELLRIINERAAGGCHDNVIVSGGCKKGADRFAEELAEELGLPIILHLPDKTKLPANPQRWHFAEINFARNELIARDSDVLIAVVADDRKGGTEDTIKHFLKTFKKPAGMLILIESDKQGKLF